MKQATPVAPTNLRDTLNGSRKKSSPVSEVGLRYKKGPKLSRADRAGRAGSSKGHCARGAVAPLGNRNNQQTSPIFLRSDA